MYNGRIASDLRLGGVMDAILNAGDVTPTLLQHIMLAIANSAYNPDGSTAASSQQAS